MGVDGATGGDIGVGLGVGVTESVGKGDAAVGEGLVCEVGSGADELPPQARIRRVRNRRQWDSRTAERFMGEFPITPPTPAPAA